MALKMALEISRSLRLPDGEFFPAARKKTGIAIHHTVGGSALSTLEHWLRDRTKAGKRRYYGERLLDFQGIIGHAMVSPDNTDPAPIQSLWDRLIADCRLTQVFIPAAEPPEPPVLTAQELELLFESNAEQIATLALAAGSLVKSLIMELERRDTYIRLYYAEQGGHRVEYEFLSGRPELVQGLANAFGFERVTDSLLQVSRG